MHRLLPLISALLWLLPSVVIAAEPDITGYAGFEYRYFEQQGPRPALPQHNLSLSGEVAFYQPLDNGRDSVRATFFGRVDENDDERSHADIRELKWHKVTRDWELTLGIDQVFWGVTETVHLVNIINQTDLVESPDGEEFLGQPMAKLSVIRDWGYLDLFVLPGFRERTFAGEDGRPGSAFRVSNTDAIYDASDEESHVDFALRWSDSIDAWDLGLSYFYGTSREPRFSAKAVQLDDSGLLEFVPIYDLIHQTGLDVQGTFDAWLWKLETIYRSGWGADFVAGAAGFEYTLFDLGESGIDIGVISEYLFDERDEWVITDNDLSLGMRLTLNDINSTEFLAAFVQDLGRDSNYYYIEASRRVGNAFTVSLEARGVGSADRNDLLRLYEPDDFIQLELNYFF